jgi:hypothetical protein
MALTAKTITAVELIKNLFIQTPFIEMTIKVYSKKESKNVVEKFEEISKISFRNLYESFYEDF